MLTVHMEIVDVQVIPVEVPVKTRDDEYGVAPYVSGTRLRELPETLTFEEALDQNDSATESGEKLLLRLETDEGIYGWGEKNVPSYRVGRGMYEDVIGPELIGRSVWEIESFVEQFDGFPSGYYRDITPYIGAAEIAMWDALGKHLQKPVHQLIGGKQKDTIPTSYCLGLLSPEESRQYAARAVDLGFDVLKTKASRYWRADVERMRVLHDGSDGQLDLRIDPNQLWSFEDAVRVGAQLEDAGIYPQFFEQPIRIDSFGTLKRLRERLRIPIGVNEDAYFLRGLFHSAMEDAIDAAVVDVVPAGGITGMQRLAGVASDMGISLAHHSNFDLGIKNAAKLHVWSSTPACNLAIDSIYYAYEDYLYEQPMTFDRGRLTVPDRPGLNGEIDEEKIEEYRLD